jgi:hypothetical protein
VIVDRVQQARVVNALEPEWEARFDRRSFGFRPGRGCHDAIQAVFGELRSRGKGVVSPASLRRLLCSLPTWLLGAWPL